MKKKLIAVLVVVALVISAIFTLVACGETTKKITVWVSEKEGVKTATEAKIKAFLEAHKEYANYEVAVQGVTEGDAATNMITDVKTGADIYCFAQDQLGRLFEANALSKLGNAGKEAVNKNDAGSVQAVTIDGNMYAYPITSDNTYFMYYDKSVITDDVDINSLEAIVAACEAASKNFSFELGGSAWYTASFFFGAGATSTWKLDAQTKKWQAADNFNSDKGLIALEGMQHLTKSSVWVDSSKASDFTASPASAVVVTGTWDSDTAKAALGENMGVAKLPSYKVGENSYQLKSFMGYKLMGVKNHEDADVHAFCHELAIFLSGKECQEDRFDKFNWGPSNKELQASDKVKSNDIMKAVAEQAQYSVVQGQIHGGWWDFAKLLGKDSKTAEATTEGRQALLTKYAEDLAKYENMSEEEMSAFTVIGNIASINDKTSADDENIIGTFSSSWTGDYRMVESEDGLTWITAKAIKLEAGDEFKCRQGQAWNLDFGYVLKDGDTLPEGKVVGDKINFVITEENAGTYKIKLTLTKDADGNITDGVIELVAE